jgi:ribosome-associated toxin RatA of RatAB toxin-antitoxin module
MPQEDRSITMKIFAEIEVDFFNFLAIVYEIDLYKKWVPFCTESQTVKQQTSNY